MADTAAAVAKRYFAAVSARDVEAMVACWAPGGRENIRGQIDTTAPEGVREYFTQLFAAFPDFDFQVLSSTSNKERAVVRWIAHGTFAGGPFGGIAATGSKIALEGMDELTVHDGLITENNAFADSMALAEQIGLLPGQDTPTYARMLTAMNAKTKLTRGLAASGPESIADGVWVVRGGFPIKTFNVYLVRDGEGVLAFDAGISSMASEIAAAAATLGGLTRVVLGHGHADHRGAAPTLGVPVFCHPADVGIAEGDGGTAGFDYSLLNPFGRRVMKPLLRMWDGGPVELAGTVEEGDDVAGFTVVHLPGHSDGMIGLHREGDGVVLSSDCFYTLDPQTARKGPPRVPLAAFNTDTEQARASIRKLASLKPSIAWGGHADPVSGDVAAQLEVAAATT